MVTYRGLSGPPPSPHNKVLLNGLSVLDLARLVALAMAAGEAGPLPALAYFFKDPVGSSQHRLAEQFTDLIAWTRTTAATTGTTFSSCFGFGLRFGYRFEFRFGFWVWVCVWVWVSVWVWV